MPSALMKTPNCPKSHGSMALKKLNKKKNFRDYDISYSVDVFVCPACGLEAGTVQSASRTQRAIADAYRAKAGI
jgi:hypothetical protein